MVYSVNISVVAGITETKNVNCYSSCYTCLFLLYQHYRRN